MKRRADHFLTSQVYAMQKVNIYLTPPPGHFLFQSCSFNRHFLAAFAIFAGYIFSYGNRYFRISVRISLLEAQQAYMHQFFTRCLVTFSTRLMSRFSISAAFFAAAFYSQCFNIIENFSSIQ
jgi:hypothetical protein